MQISFSIQNCHSNFISYQKFRIIFPYSILPKLVTQPLFLLNFFLKIVAQISSLFNFYQTYFINFPSIQFLSNKSKAYFTNLPSIHFYHQIHSNSYQKHSIFLLSTPTRKWTSNSSSFHSKSQLNFPSSKQKRPSPSGFKNHQQH
jgi:hypothetical protein